MSRFSLPPEWAPQQAVQLTWPHPHGDWRPWLDRVEPVFLAIAKAVTEREELIVACYDDAQRDLIREKLVAVGARIERVRLHVVASNDTWARDHGPITLLGADGKRRLLDFQFNGWGNKYDATLDNQITWKLHAQGAFGDAGIERVDLVLEGGSVEVDGRGTLLTTALCLLSPERNPQLDRAGVVAALTGKLGLERVLWLEHGHLEGDDTDGHIDTLARFCDAQTIAHVSCEDESDPHFEPLRAMAGELAALRTPDGAPYRLVALPLPAPIRDEEGKRLPATHANFLIINGAVLVPTYRDPNDAVALARLAECFPDREIVPIDCWPLVFQYGSLHCVTMQIPAGAGG